MMMDCVLVPAHLNVYWLRAERGSRSFHAGRPGDCIMIFSQGTAGAKEARGRRAAPAKRAVAAAWSVQCSETQSEPTPVGTHS
jgi:hypothetical protein